MKPNRLAEDRLSPSPALGARNHGCGAFGKISVAVCAWLALTSHPARAEGVAIPNADGKILGRVSVESVNLDRVEAALAPGGRAAAASVRHGRYGGATLELLEPGRQAKVLLEAGVDQVLSDPIWSPDGTLIAVVVRGPARRSPGVRILQQGGALWLCARAGACARASLAEDFWRPAAFLEDGTLLAARILPGDLIDLAPARIDPLSGGSADLPRTPQTMALVEPPELFPPLPAPGVVKEPSTRQALSMPYIHQVYDTPNDFNGHWACGPTSTLMAVLHFNRLDPWPVTVSVPYSHNSDFGAYVAYTYSAYGSTFNRVQNDASGHAATGAYGWCTEDGAAWAWRMQDYAERHDLDTTFDGQATFSEIQAALDAGKVVALSTRLTSAGHLITVKGTTADGRLITNDPYGDKNQGYMNYKGEGAVYTWAQVSAKWFITVHGSGAVSKGTAIGSVYIDRGTDNMDERIVGATVSVEGGASTTAREGDAIWSFELAPANYTIRASAAGFEPASRSCTVEAGAQTWCSIGLTVACEPDCGGRDCGDDGCGGSCGECPDHHACTDGLCECQPDCTGLACGPDPDCGASCGDCPAGQACQAGACGCVPQCDGRTCGDDGCGGSCGDCAQGQECDALGQCRATECAPTCTERECGPDPTCGESCGECPGDQFCDAEGRCQIIHGGCATADGGNAGAAFVLIGVFWLLSLCRSKIRARFSRMETRNRRSAPGSIRLLGLFLLPLLGLLPVLLQACGGGAAPGPADGGSDADGGCVPNCALRVCGDDGCGGSCGECGASQECAPNGQCVPACEPDCQGRECGLDPICGALDCGTCEPDQTCSDQGTCVPTCASDCTGRVCGDDGCGGSCGDCDAGAGEVCVEASGQCVACAPDCAGLECGLDPVCGSSCGVCEPGYACNPDGQCGQQCSPDCGQAVCGPDPVCGTLDCGACPPEETCDDQGQCVSACVPDCQGRVCGPDPVCGTLDCGACSEGTTCTGGQCTPAGCGDFCEPFSIVLLPDTQYYTAKQAAGPQNTLFKQLQWVLDHRQDHDIRFAIHLGDITNNNTRTQWNVADAAFDLFDAAGMPYSVMPGNHDYKGGDGTPGRSETLMNDAAYFPPSRFAGRPWYGGSYGSGNQNNYALFEVGPYKFMVINLEYGPRKGPLCWAEDLIESHPDRRVIIVSHCIQTHGGGFNQSCPDASWLMVGGSGQSIWDELASRHSNVFLMVSGHINDSEYRLRHGVAGNPVHTILTDYQMEGVHSCRSGTYTGNGWMRELVFTPQENRVYVRTFTVEDGNGTLFSGGVPTLYCDNYNKDPASATHQFDFAYDLSTAAPDIRQEGGRAFVDQTVNTVGAGDQVQAVLAGRPAGGFVAAWEDDSAGTPDVMMRGFEPGGCQAFSQRMAPADDAGTQLAPAAGMAADGSFVVAWQDDTDGNGVYQIHARGFGADGEQRFARITVNSVSAGQQKNPAVAVAPDGRFCVAWEDDRDGDGDMQVWLRGFEADGSQRFAERSVHADVAGKRQRPALAATPDGGCVVVWEDDGDGNGVYQIHARGFRADGSERFARRTVNSQAAGQQRNPAVAADDGGGFVVVWEDDPDRDGDYQLLARGFEVDGSQRFADMRVHKVAGGQHRAPVVVAAPSGAFAVAWQDDGDGNGKYQIHVRGFTALGAVSLAEQTVNRIADGQQLAPGLALDDTGALAIIWQDDMDGNGYYQLLARGLDWPLP